MPDWRWPAPYVDHLERIPNTETLYRRVAKANLKTVDEAGVPILDTQSFQDLPLKKANEKGYELRCMSIGIGSILEVDGGPEAMLANLPEGEYGIAVFTAECLRADGQQGIMYAPEPGEPWHAVVFAKDKKQRSGGMEKATLRCASWWQLPSGEHVG